MGAVWLFCCIGILYLTRFGEGIAIPLALLTMLLVATGVGGYLLVIAHRRLRELDRMIIEKRAEELREKTPKAAPLSPSERFPGS